MKKYFPLLSVAVILLTLPGCQLIGDIFKAGVWAGVLLVVFIVGLIIWIIARMGKSK